MLDILFRILKHLFVPLVLTVIIEGAIIFVLFRRWDYIYYTLLLNVLTNLILNYTLLVYASYAGVDDYYVLLYVLEVVVVAVEGIIFAKLAEMKIIKALLVSLLLNASSYLVGLILL